MEVCFLEFFQETRFLKFYKSETNDTSIIFDKNVAHDNQAPLFLTDKGKNKLVTPIFTWLSKEPQ